MSIIIINDDIDLRMTLFRPDLCCRLPAAFSVCSR